MSSFITVPEIQDTGHTRNGVAIFEVVSDLTYELFPGVQFTVPGRTNDKPLTGYLTDYASIPRFFWRLMSPTGWYRFACVLHDFLYTWELSLCSKTLADAVLWDAMGVIPYVGTLTRWRKTQRRAIYSAVHYWGNYPSSPITL